MTIKWGDPIECNGVRPDWLRNPTPFKWSHDGVEFTKSAGGDPEDYVWSDIRAFRVRDDHPAYVALARGFTPWSGGESAPDDWDGGDVLVLDGYGTSRQRKDPREINTAKLENWSGEGYAVQIIGYRKRKTGFDEPHLARIEVEGSAPVEGVFIKRMTEAEARDLHSRVSRSMGSSGFRDSKWADCTMATLRELGLLESRAERFTRETGHAVTEAVEAALNWKGE